MYIRFSKVSKYEFHHDYINPIGGRLFRTFERQGAFLPASKNFYKNILLHPNHMEVSTTHLWTLTKILTLVTWSKWWRQHYFWWRNHSRKTFCLSFKFLLCLKSTAFFKVGKQREADKQREGHETYLHSQPSQAQATLKMMS